MTDDETIIAAVEASLKTPEHRAKRKTFAAGLRRQQPSASSKDVWMLAVVALLVGLAIVAVVAAATGG